jgi:hypothetical protein
MVSATSLRRGESGACTVLPAMRDDAGGAGGAKQAKGRGVGRPGETMTRIYIVVSVVGWVWCVAAGAFVYVKWRRKQSGESKHDQH